MKLAIVLGISSYNAPYSSLPACVKEAAIFAEFLTRTAKFDEILTLVTETTSSSVKSKLAEFVAKYKGKEVAELFFYYTGHGDMHADGFYFPLSDFREDRRKQTSITNDEIDGMFRSLNPNLTIKIVDACHSGVAYVKEADALKKSLAKSEEKYHHCYFMFSSLDSQSSFQDASFSDFTKSFLSACAQYAGTQIRYRDVMDYIADDFASSQSQTPVFLSQATNTEVFCSLDDGLREHLRQSLSGNVKSGSAKRKDEDHPQQPNLVALIRKNAADFCTKEEYIAFFAKFADVVHKARFGETLEELYKFSSEFRNDLDTVENPATIGKWIKENSQTGYFATETYGKEIYYERVPKQRGPYSRITQSLVPIALMSDDQLEWAERERQVVNGFQYTTEPPYKTILIVAKPVLENVPTYSLTITFVFSKVECVMFHYFSVFKEVDWGKVAPGKNSKWYFAKAQMKHLETAERTWAEIERGFEAFVLEQLEQAAGIKRDQSPTGAEGKNKPSIPNNEDGKAKKEKA